MGNIPKDSVLEACHTGGLQFCFLLMFFPGSLIIADDPTFWFKFLSILLNYNTKIHLKIWTKFQCCYLLALQIASPKDGLYFLNGPNTVGQRNTAYAAGAEWIYTKQDSENVESITSAGPVQENVDIMLIYNQPNPGIKYEFMIPAETSNVVVNTPTPSSINSRRHAGFGQSSADSRRNEIETRRYENRLMINQQNDETRTHRRRKRKFVWKIVSMTQCTKSCGGGKDFVSSNFKTGNELIKSMRNWKKNSSLCVIFVSEFSHQAILISL